MERFSVFINLYILLLMIFLGSIGGLTFYKVSYKFLFPKNISYILGGIVSLLLSYQVVIIVMAQELLFGVLVVLIVYIIFVVISKKHFE